MSGERVFTTYATPSPNVNRNKQKGINREEESNYSAHGYKRKVYEGLSEGVPEYRNGIYGFPCEYSTEDRNECYNDRVSAKVTV